MKLAVGDMWSAFDEADLFLFTGNNVVTVAGKLVMGRGMAKQVKDRFPDIPENLGRYILQRYGNRGVYHLLISPVWHMANDIAVMSTAKIGAFQVKLDWKSPADIPLIRDSALVLRWFALNHHDSQIHMNYPGIGNGKLHREMVEPLITKLPDNVTVWRLP